MTIIGILQGLILFATILALTKPLGAYLARVFSREHTFLDPILSPIEHFIYRISRGNTSEEMQWQRNAINMHKR